MYSNIEQIVNVLSNTRLPFIVDCYYVVGLLSPSTQSSLGTLFVESSLVPVGYRVNIFGFCAFQSRKLGASPVECFRVNA